MTHFQEGHPTQADTGGTRAWGAQHNKFKSLFAKKMTDERMDELVDQFWEQLTEDEPLFVGDNSDSARVAWKRLQHDRLMHAFHLLLGKDPQILVQINTPNNARDVNSAIARLAAMVGRDKLPPGLQRQLERQNREVIDADPGAD